MERKVSLDRYMKGGNFSLATIANKTGLSRSMISKLVAAERSGDAVKAVLVNGDITMIVVRQPQWRVCKGQDQVIGKRAKN